MHKPIVWLALFGVLAAIRASSGQQPVAPKPLRTEVYHGDMTNCYGELIVDQRGVQFIDHSVYPGKDHSLSLSHEQILEYRFLDNRDRHELALGAALWFRIEKWRRDNGEFGFSSQSYIFAVVDKNDKSPFGPSNTAPLWDEFEAARKVMDYYHKRSK